MDFEKEQRGTVLRCKESELMIYTLNNRLMTTLTVPANEILLDNIMRVMSGEYFGVRKAAKIVGGRRKLERLIEAGKIEFAKPVIGIKEPAPANFPILLNKFSPVKNALIPISTIETIVPDICLSNPLYLQ